MATVTVTHAWERSLLSRAFEAWQAGAASAHTVADKVLLDRAYAHCTALTASHSRSFYLASGLLPYEKRRAIRALYAFCRVSDDIVDQPGAGTRDSFAANRELFAWQHKSLVGQEATGDRVAGDFVTDLVALAWNETRLRYGIPYRYAEQLIEGVRRDLDQQRYATFEDLAAYAYGVASTVGLMSMHIIGFSGAEAIPYAVKLGVALQVTNILRDVGEDWQAGRVYLPAAELAAFDLTERDLAGGRVDARWRAFMRFQIDRNRQLYAEVWPGISLLDPDGRLAVAAAGEFYQGILADIEAHDYDVFHRRAYLSAWRKLTRLPGIWWRCR